MSNPENIAKLYDSLSIWETLFGYRSAKETVHKQLNFASNPAFEHISDINELLLNLPLGLDANSKILDAGCGHGGTLLSFIRKYNCSGTGISLSHKQIEAAKQHPNGKGAHFEVQSYDTPPAEQFDLIICVEALLHSANLQNTYKALSAVLAPGGKMLIVEDMFPLADKIAATTLGKCSAAQFQEFWSVKQFYPPKAHQNAAREAGLLSVENGSLAPQDLTELVPSKPLEVLQKRVNQSHRFLKYAPSASLRTATRAAIGGYFLEYLYQQNLAAYRLMVFEKSH